MGTLNNKLLVKNSIFLYGRMLLTVWLNLYITRLVFIELGEEAFGAYGVVGSIVSIVSIINTGVIATNQRFISYEIGKPNGNVNLVFNTLLNIIFIFAIFAFIVMELIGLWYIKHKMNIPESIHSEAIWVFHFSVITSIVTLLSAPYNALIIAHEKMDVFAYISIFQVVLTFVGVWSLRFFIDNKLFLYGLILLIVCIIVRAMYQIYCQIFFNDCKYRCVIDKSNLKNICSFTGFSILDGGLNTITWQGIIVIINVFFGVTVNAAYTISVNLKNLLLSFAQNVQKALSPQITKTYAENNYKAHAYLIYNGSKAQIFLLFILVIPILIKTKYILSIWIGDFPKYSILFCQLGLLMALLNAAFETVRTSVYATGNIRNLILISNTCHLTLLPVCYILNNIYNSTILMIIVVVVYDYLIYGLRFYLASRVSPFSINKFTTKVVIPCVSIGIIALLCSYFINNYISDTIWGFLILTFINFTILSIMFYVFGLSKDEKHYIKVHAYSFVSHIKGK